ncbi:PH domain-containing protein [Actinokineospora iranica]|uniref:PH domain-containing protein n=1 Tax=Actinokineospora iranica TaxID=1271860 RepID=A0A1G6PFY7_9PSEU|nr:PH domain-containing protein [Actinokineospora iranica]SDC79063.1 PH domain-containing protein [Actinokineospora iranica]
MDRSRQWAPRPPVVGVAWLLTAAAALAAALIGDPRGALLLAVAAVMLGVLALFGTVARPRLAADPTGLTVRGLTGRRRWSWGEVNVRLVRSRRFGRESTAVEIDADNAARPALVILGELDLGADPRDVVDDLLRLRT